MKYFLEIEGRSFDNVSSVIINKGYRTETKKENLGGDLLIDRVGSEKTDLQAKVNMLSDEDMKHLRSCRNKMAVAVKYYEGNTLTEKTMYLKEFKEPSPLYFYGKRENGLVYGTVTLPLTEI